METGEGLVAVVVIVVALFIVAFLWELARRTWYWTAAKIYGWSEEEKLVSLLMPRRRPDRALPLADLPQPPRGLSVLCLGA